MNSPDPIIVEDARAVLEACAPDLDKLAGQTVLLTGATGFIGGSVADALAAFNATASTPCELWLAVRSIEDARRRRPDLAGERGVHWLEWPLASAGPRRCEYIVHAAAPVAAALSGESGATRDIVELAAQVVEWGKRRKAQAMLLLSSGAVYGTLPAELARVPESHARGATDPYGQAKLRCEALFAGSGIPSTAARVFGCFGPRQSLDAPFAIPDFFRQILQRGAIRIASDGRAQRSFVYISDAAAALLKLLLRAGSMPVCNVGGELPVVSVAELARLVAKAWGSADVAVEGSKADTMRPRYVPDVSLMKKIHAPRVTLEDGLRRTAQAIRHAAAALRA